MNQPNLYMKTYQQSIGTVQNIKTKQHFFHLAVNLGQVHNLLGQMISDIINIMGTFPFHDQRSENNKHQPKRNQNQKLKPKGKGKFANSHIQKQPIPPTLPLDKYLPQKMEIQPNPSNPPNIHNTNTNQINKTINFPEYLFQTQQKPKPQNIPKPFMQDFYRDILLTTDKKQSQSSIQTSSRKGSNDSSSSKTQTAQIVRSNPNQQKLTTKNSFDQLNQYVMENDHDLNPYNVNVRKTKQQDKKVKKHKSPFFDLFDSSQTQSYQKSSNHINLDPQSFQDIEKIDKTYSRTQQVNNSSNNLFKKQEKKVFSPQMKKEKQLNNVKNEGFQKSTNLLDITQWNNSGQGTMFQVQQEIDEIQSSEKKPFKRVVANRKNVQKQQVQSDNVPYIPRREQNGRKKSDRQGLQGSQCPDCKAFYDAVSEDSKNFKDMCQCTSRHKSSTTFMGQHKVQNFSQDFKLN